MPPILYRFIGTSIFCLLLMTCKNETQTNSEQLSTVTLLLNSDISKWKLASEEEKLDICEHFISKSLKNTSEDYRLLKSIKLKDCINNAMNEGIITENVILSDVASICLIIIDK